MPELIARLFDRVRSDERENSAPVFKIARMTAAADRSIDNKQPGCGARKSTASAPAPGDGK